MAENWEVEWEAQMGAVPPFVRELHELLPEAEAAYRTTRQAIFSERDGGLTTAHKELLLLVMNVALNNVDGALNHLRLARRAGLGEPALREALATCMLYLGVISHVRIGQVLWRAAQEPEDRA
jgi:alkylhydroperoxidase/carboxymuconolactone decarboxylase family protein YurZ